MFLRPVKASCFNDVTCIFTCNVCRICRCIRCPWTLMFAGKKTWCSRLQEHNGITFFVTVPFSQESLNSVNVVGATLLYVNDQNQDWNPVCSTLCSDVKVIYWSSERCIMWVWAFSSLYSWLLIYGREPDALHVSAL